jgi:probable blue pigment (indigoidine) exporter
MVPFPVPTRGQLLAFGSFAFVAVVWGGSYVAITVGLEHAPATFFAATRMYLGAVVVLPVAAIWYKQWLPRSRADLIGVIVAGVFITGGSNWLLFYGQQFTTSSVAAVVFAMNPILATAFAWVLVAKERLNPLEFCGVALGFVGVLVIADPNPGNLLAPDAVGNWIVLAGGGLLGIGSVLSRRIDTQLSIVPLLGWGLTLAAVLLHLTSLLLGETPPASWPLSLTIAAFYLGVPSTAGAFLAYYLLMDLVGAVRTTLVSYAVPVFTALIAWLLLGEVIAPRTVVGFLIITTGFALTEHQRFPILFRVTTEYIGDD